ncbi:MAG: HD domain-containing protein [Eubacteriales bacterium]|nr:HD domain-containing protein [Eubacteriales bacterium]
MANTQSPLTGLIKGQMFEGYLLVRASSQRTGQTGSKYLDMTLCDRSGEVNAKMWDGTTPAPAVGSVVKVRGMMQEYNNRPQLRVDKMRPSEPGDPFEMSMLVPCAPYPAEEMYAAVRARAQAIAEDDLRAIVTIRLDEVEQKLLYAPAAMRLHHSERSGLLHHTSTMLKTADAVCAVYEHLDADLIAAGVILHDLGKINEMHYDEMGVVSDYTVEGMLIGHLVQGAADVRRVGEQVGARPELIWMLQHMLLSHHDLPEYGSPKPPMFPEAEVLHILDLLDARMFEMTQALSGIAPGGFTERIWSLERKLYRRQRRPGEADANE